jgi:hypothetical protein
VRGVFDWYWLGVVIGLGVAAGAGLVAARARHPVALLVPALGAIAITIVLVWLPVWAFAALAVALVIGLSFLRHLSAAALPAASLGLAAIAFVPLVGYLEAGAVPLLGQRLGRRAGERYAGLRILAKD